MSIAILTVEQGKTGLVPFDDVNTLFIEGTDTLTSPYVVIASGDVANYSKVHIHYRARLTYSGAGSITILGQLIPEEMALADFDAVAYYSGDWIVTFYGGSAASRKILALMEAAGINEDDIANIIALRT